MTAVGRKKTSSKGKRSTTDEPVDETAEGATADTGEDSELPEKPVVELTKEEKRLLFNEYQDCKSLVAEAEGAVAETKRAQSAVVEKIYNLMGAGPFKWKGQQLRIVARSGSYYMRVLVGEAEEI